MITTYLVTQYKALGGSHCAYTEGLYEEFTGEAASNVGTESNFRTGSRLVFLTLEAEGNKVKKTEKIIITQARAVSVMWIFLQMVQSVSSPGKITTQMISIFMKWSLRVESTDISS